MSGASGTPLKVRWRKGKVCIYMRRGGMSIVRIQCINSSVYFSRVVSDLGICFSDGIK